jgi:hypothetical protein
MANLGGPARDIAPRISPMLYRARYVNNRYSRHAPATVAQIVKLWGKKGVAMNRQSPYSWFPAYIAAAFKIDFSRLYQRIDQAFRAIESRLDGTRNLDDANSPKFKTRCGHLDC